MKTTNLLRLASLLVVATGASIPALASNKAAAQIERGRYLVHNVAGCIDCHSPRNERGQFLEDKHLTGSVLAFAPTVPMPWAPAAPAIAGLEGYTNEQAVHFLMTGERPSHVAPRPPMPEYRLNKDDATAIVAYLKSLKSVTTVADAR